MCDHNEPTKTALGNIFFVCVGLWRDSTVHDKIWGMFFPSIPLKILQLSTKTVKLMLKRIYLSFKVFLYFTNLIYVTTAVQTAKQQTTGIQLFQFVKPENVDIAFFGHLRLSVS